MYKNTVLTLVALAIASQATSQASDPRLAESKDRARVEQAERDGVSVRIKDIARFRGVRPNMLQGYGIVVGLAGTGDSQQTSFTATLLENALKRWGTIIAPGSFKPKNVAAVSLTAELPPFVAPGSSIDVTVGSIGDAKSLEGGQLLMSPLYGPGDFQTVIAVCQGAVSIGGFNAGSGGSSSRKNHTNVGRVPNGALVEKSVDTQTLFAGNKLFLELYAPDLTTSQRVATALAIELSGYAVTPIDGGTIEIALPDGETAMMAMSLIEQASVNADVPAVVVVNERTGTVVIGGNVRLGPAVIAHSSLQVRIESSPVISQPAPFSTGTTVQTSEDTVTAEEQKTQVAVLRPNTTINDLAKILQALELSARDIIAILQALAEQGALKAKVKIQ